MSDIQATPTHSVVRLAHNESIYLDIVRSLAALNVVFGHACELYDLPATGRWGHFAVMVFFVLSGYLIAFSAAHRDGDLQTFLIARLARLWSVLIPAMILTIVCDLIGLTFGIFPRGLASVPMDHPLIRIGAMLTFVSETWVSIQPLSNGAAWSLCLEFWYYVTFGLWTYMRPGRLRTGLTSISLLLSGHKGILLFPVWMMGVNLQKTSSLRNHSVATDALLWLTSLILISTIMLERLFDPIMRFVIENTNPWLMTQLAQARAFPLDWMFGLLVTAHLLASRRIAEFLPLKRLEKPARWCAGVSFAVYLFHAPLLHLTASFLNPNQGWLAIALTLAAISVLGPPAESSKRQWRRWLGTALKFAEARVALVGSRS